MSDALHKASLRRVMRQRRAALAGDARLAARERIDQAVEAFVASLGAAGGRAIALFAPADTEAGPLAAPARLRARGWVTAYPRVDGDALDFVDVRDDADLAPGHRGLLEPPADGPRVGTAGFGAVFVPGLAFDRRGGRLGQGGGHYDRFLTRLSPGTPRLGVAFACQVVAAVPVDPWDIAMDFLVTDEGLVASRP